MFFFGRAGGRGRVLGERGEGIYSALFSILEGDACVQKLILGLKVGRKEEKGKKEWKGGLGQRDDGYCLNQSGHVFMFMFRNQDAGLMKHCFFFPLILSFLVQSPLFSSCMVCWVSDQGKGKGKGFIRLFFRGFFLREREINRIRVGKGRGRSR